MARDPARRGRVGSARVRVALGIVVAGLLAAWALDLSPADLVPSRAGLDVAGRFLVRALTPALRSESEVVPEQDVALLPHALEAAWMTLLFASAAMGLALVLGVGLGFLASTAWWADDVVGRGGRAARVLRASVAPLLYGVTRVLIALLRSIHELLWAVLFLVAFGLDHGTAVLAIALPYAGILAKVFSEMVDEAPRDAAHALRAAGASPLQVFWFGLVPRAVPDMAAYAFYRFECALRSAAILGFFGLPTLGWSIKASFVSGHYGEVWTYLYVLFAMVAVFEWWSGALRLRTIA